ncbi:Ig-like domain-containing protein [bacterium]|nr:Ig-like domain-containing protein [bacterium]
MNGILIKGLALSALLGLLFIACKSDSGKVQSYDTESPHVISLSPGDASSDVPVNTSLSVGFDEAMYPSTINFNSEDTNCSGSLQLSRDGFFSCVPMSSTSLSISPDKKVFSISPKSSLQGSATYKLKITTKAKDLALNPLKQDFVMSSGFTTRLLAGAQAIYFGDENTKENELTGTIKIERALNESGLTGYNLYWGSGPDTRLAGSSPMRYFYVSETKLEHYLENMAIPGGATHFLVYSATATGESLTPVSLDIPDTVLKMVADINSSGPANPHTYCVWNNKLYFSADDGTGTTGAELWEYDGVSSPKLAADIWGGPDSSMILPGKMVVFNNKLYFQARNGGFNNYELWSYDGTTASLVYDINQTVDGGSTFGSSPVELTVFDGKLYFYACGGTGSGCELWFWDGTAPSLGTTIKEIVDIAGGSSNSFIKDLTVFNGRLYFTANDNVTYGNEIWWYNGSTATLIYNTDYGALDIRTASASSDPEDITVFNGRLIFGADQGIGDGKELWFYDGFAPNPVLPANYNLLANITGDSSSSSPKGFTELNGKLYFSATTAAYGTELWVYNGVNPPNRISDIASGSASANPSFLTVYKDMLIFSATTAEHGTELYGYMTNDPSGSPFMIGDINNGAGGSMPEFLTIFNNRLYFTANDGIKGNEIWVFYIE